MCLGEGQNEPRSKMRAPSWATSSEGRALFAFDGGAVRNRRPPVPRSAAPAMRLTVEALPAALASRDRSTASLSLVGFVARNESRNRLSPPRNGDGLPILGFGQKREEFGFGLGCLKNFHELTSRFDQSHYFQRR